MQTRSREPKTELRTRVVPKARKLEVYVEVPPLCRTRCTRHPSLPSVSNAPSQPLNPGQPNPSVVFTPPPPPPPHGTPVAQDSKATPTPTQVKQSPSTPAPPLPQLRVVGSISAPAAVSPLRQAPAVPAVGAALKVPSLQPQLRVEASQPAAAIMSPMRDNPAAPTVGSILPASALSPTLPRGPPPPVPPAWTYPHRLDPSLAPTHSVDPVPATQSVASTEDTGATSETRLNQPGSVPCIDLTQLKRRNHFDDEHLRFLAAQPIHPVHVPPVEQLFHDDDLPPSSPTYSLPPVSSPVYSNLNDNLADDTQPTRSLRSTKSVQFVANDEQEDKEQEDQDQEDDEIEDMPGNGCDDDYQQEGPDDEDDEQELAEEVVTENVLDAKKPRSKSTKYTSKRQSSKGKGKKSTAKSASKASKKTQKGKKLSLYEGEDDEDSDNSRDSEDDPDAPQFEPNAAKYTHAPGPLSKECLAEVNQLVYEFDTKMNAIGRKYHKSVASLWGAANMSKAGGVRELSSWNAFLAYRTKKEHAKANPGETNSDFVVRLGEEYKELMQELLGEDWEDSDQRRQVAKEHGWLDFVQEAQLEVTRDERENGVKKSTMQRCINEILKLVHLCKELKSMSAKLHVAKDQEEKGLEGKAVIQHLLNEYHSNPHSTDYLRKLYANIFNEEINEATEGERSKIKYGDFYSLASDKNVRLTHWPAGLLVEKLCAGEFPNARDLGSDKLKEFLCKRTQYWEALFKRADLRSEEEQQIVSEQDMGPHIVAWSKEEVLTPWCEQYQIPLIIDDEGTILLMVRDVSQLKAQKNAKDSKNVDDDISDTDDRRTANGKGKEKATDGGTRSDDEDDEDDEDDDTTWDPLFLGIEWFVEIEF
ncbi:hypothetical protein VKT23_016224 [Stygiomarasmius scandens]|uniref:Uncharacterized protein n=1 Tax=Marasmiellus scandens TaxID=2682957 RepID=A0ABR1IY24_9AGAR